VLIAEADEYDRAFHALESAVAVITNIDLEHLDTYRDLDDLQAAFVRFADAGDPAGAVVAGIDSAAVGAVVPRLARRCVTFATGVPARVGARGIEVGPDGTRFELTLDGRPALAIALKVPGAHNVRNALAAIAAAREVGVPLEVAAAALAGFEGIARRFEIRGERDGVLLVDDYAHHPTEMAATLDAARRLFPKRRLVVVFQPHLYSRTRDLAGAMGGALLGAHVALVAPIYPARERPIEGVTGALIAEAAVAGGHPRARALRSDEEVAPAVRAELRRGDVLLTMGAGDVARFGDFILLRTE
jgi:UDP-N-acetylmuramate--alanine ligase